MGKLVKKLGKDARIEVDGSIFEGYTVREFRNEELYMETEFDDIDSAVEEATNVVRNWEEKHAEKNANNNTY